MKWHPQSASRRTLRWTRWLVLALLLPLLLLAAFGQWWLLPHLNDYRDDLAAALRDYLQVPVHIEAVAATREGWRLGLQLQGVSLHDPNSGATRVSFSRAAATLNLWRSLQTRHPVFSHIRLEGANLTLELGPDGIPRSLTDASTVGSASSLPDIGRWLFNLRRLEIVGGQLTVRRHDGLTLQILHPYLQLQQTAQGQRLAFTAELPPQMGDRIQMTVERPRSDPEQWQGAFQLHADRLNAAGWPLPLTFTAGQATLDLRGEWRDWQPTRMEGRLQLHQAAVQREPRFALLEPWLAKRPDNELTFDWRRQETGWQLHGHVRYSDDAGRQSIPPSLELTQTSGQWQGHLRDVRAQDLWAWITPWLDEPARRWLIPLDPHGNVPDIEIQVEPAASAYTATAQLRDVAWQPTHGLPGLDNVTGSLTFTPKQGHITLDSHMVRANTKGLLRAPVTFDTVAGTLSWQRTADGLQLESPGLNLVNADLNARFQGQISLPDAGGPLLDLRGEYRDVKVSQARRYLPVAVIPPEGVAWLDQALINGRVTSGTLIFRGPPAAFPFDKDEGLFETRFQVADAVLDYMPGWPRLEQVRATVQFRNRGLWVEASSGRLRDAEVEGITTRIDDLSEVVVQVKGRAKGPGASMWRALQDSPSRRQLGEDLPDLRIGGVNTLDLDLSIPTDSRPTQIRGRVGLLENTVTLPSWAIELVRLRGEVRFTEADLEARDVQTLLRGEPIRLHLNLIGREGRRELQVRLQGRLGLRALVGEPATALEPYASGKSAWEAILTLPTGRRERRNAAPTFTLNLTSDLRGIAVNLPDPLGKTANELRPVKISLRPRERDTLDLTLEDGQTVKAVLELNYRPRDFRLARGEVRINAGTAKLPETSGLTITANLPRWDLMALAPRSDASKTVNAMGALRGFNARIGELLIGGHAFSEVTLQASRQENSLQIDLGSAALAGRITVPDTPTPQQPVNAALQRLYLRPAVRTLSSDAKTTDPDPRRLPPFTLTVDDLRLHDIALGQLRLNAAPSPAGLHFNLIELNSERQSLSASGDWRRTNGAQTSQFQATLHSQALGETLAAFGYPGASIARGETHANASVSWAAAPSDLSLERLDGSLTFRVEQGQLLEFSPGLGRLMGLFSLQSLSRRLNFDFSDLFQPGMGFDQITGALTFKHGLAEVKDLTLEAPAAQIQVQGQIGLTTRAYNQTITVTPRFGGALPVAGAIAGGPAVGAAVFVAERLLQKEIEHATRYRYTLKGSWDDPVLEPLQETAPAASTTKGFAGKN